MDETEGLDIEVDEAPRNPDDTYPFENLSPNNPDDVSSTPENSLVVDFKVPAEVNVVLVTDTTGKDLTGLKVRFEVEDEDGNLINPIIVTVSDGELTIHPNFNSVRKIVVTIISSPISTINITLEFLGCFHPGTLILPFLES